MFQSHIRLDRKSRTNCTSAQFPVAVIDRIIKACSREGELVLDLLPQFGSAIEAALNNGRAAIGFEIERSYVSIAARRIEKFSACRKCEMAQSSLFEDDSDRFPVISAIGYRIEPGLLSRLGCLADPIRVIEPSEADQSSEDFYRLP